MEKITLFKANMGKNSKIPHSPTNDKEFVFSTHKIQNPRQMYQVMVNNFILNIPLNLEKPIKSRRKIKALKDYIPEDITYIVLDIDDVKSSSAMNEILDYFRPYSCILGESKSHNGIDNFRLKGILFVESVSLRNARVLLSQIHYELKHLCNIDEASTRRVSINAPIGKMKILMESKGPRYEFNLRNAQDIINSHRESYIEKELNISEIFNNDSIQNPSSIEELCLSVFHSMGFSAMEDNSANGAITFQHPNEVKTPGGYFWFWSSPYTMHHFNSTKTVNIFDAVRKLDAAKNLLKKEIDYDDVLYKETHISNLITVNSQYLKVTDEIQTSIEEFIQEPDGLFSIKSPMGTGKSTIIGHLIDECNDMDMRVLIITNRISVARDFSNKYNIKLYNKDLYNVGDSVVVQYDSLWKYNIKNFDVVIMDEFISLMIHSRNNLSNSSVNIAKFFAAFNKKLVIADAFLTGYENFLINHKKSNIHLLDNQYRDETELLNYEDLNYFIQSVIRKADVLDVKNHEKITISSTSLAIINELELLLNNRGLKTVTLTAETSESTKELVYGLFNEDHDKFDVLLYSPTLTVGISNMNNVKDHFHYDSSMSSDVISSLQMIKRSRKAEKIHLLIRPRIKYLRTTYNEIRDDYMNNIGQNIGQNYLFEVDNYGEPRLSKIGIKAIKIDTFSNILEFNHRDAFFYLCKYHFKNAAIEITDKFEGNALSKYRAELKKSNVEIAQMRINEFFLLNDMEKYDISVGKKEADRIMKTLIDVDSSIIPDCAELIKKEILENSIRDPRFINKCKLFKHAKEFLEGNLTEKDISYFINEAVLKKSDDLRFYNLLLELENPLKDSYVPREVNSNFRLKYVLEKIGYSTARDSTEVGYRGFDVNEEVKKLYKFIQ